MKLYILTYGTNTPRAFESREDCAWAVAALLREEEAERLWSEERAERHIANAEEEQDEAIFAVDWRYNLVVRVYAVEVERRF